MESQNPLGTCYIIRDQLAAVDTGHVLHAGTLLAYYTEILKISELQLRVSKSPFYVSQFHTQQKATNINANRRPWTLDWHLHVVGKYWVGISNLLMVFLGDLAIDAIRKFRSLIYDDETD